MPCQRHFLFASHDYPRNAHLIHFQAAQVRNSDTRAQQGWRQNEARNEIWTGKPSNDYLWSLRPEKCFLANVSCPTPSDTAKS